MEANPAKLDLRDRTRTCASALAGCPKRVLRLCNCALRLTCRCHCGGEASGSHPGLTRWWDSDCHRALLIAGNAQGGRSRVGAGGSVGVLGRYQVE
jgi:hypothetical protein